MDASGYFAGCDTVRESEQEVLVVERTSDLGLTAIPSMQ